MSEPSHRAYLLTEQYRDASNLNARAQLHARFSTNQYGWHRWVFDQLDLAPQSEIFELGCGPGLLWRQNIERIQDKWEITLTDLSEGMIREARANLSHSPHRFRFAVTDAQAVPFTDQTFDAVIANHMLYHVPDRAQAFAEIRRILRPAGRFFAATNGEAHLRELDGLLNRFGTDTTVGATPDNFTLENGADQLAPYFGNVQVVRYDDALVVPEIEPLVAYALSTPAKSILVGDKLLEFEKTLRQALARDGAIRITKDSGIFVAAAA